MPIIDSTGVTLAIGAIPNGQFLRRVDDTLLGATPLAAPTSPGSLTIAAETVYNQNDRLTFVGADRLTMAGTERLVLAGADRLTLTGAERLTLAIAGRLLLRSSGSTGSVILGSPKAPTVSFTVPTEYFLDQMFRMALVGNQRATLQGTADLVVSDDFNTRSRIVLAGRG